MAYLLILLVGFYAALAAMIGHRFPRRVSSIVMVFNAAARPCPLAFWCWHHD